MGIKSIMAKATIEKEKNEKHIKYSKQQYQKKVSNKQTN